MSPAGAILFPVNSITVREGTVSCSETPRSAVCIFRRGERPLKMRALNDSAARNVVPDDARSAHAKVAQQRLAAFIFIARPCSSCRRASQGGRGDHRGQGCFPAAPLPRNDEEGRPLIERDALNHGQRSRNCDGFPIRVGGHVNQPFVRQKIIGVDGLLIRDRGGIRHTLKQGRLDLVENARIPIKANASDRSARDR